MADKNQPIAVLHWVEIYVARNWNAILVANQVDCNVLG